MTKIVNGSENAQLLSWTAAKNQTDSSLKLKLPAIHQYISHIALRFPNATALHWWPGNSNDEIQLSYAELEERADALARVLAHREDLKVKKGDIVLAFFDKGIDMIVGILGIATGAAYVPIDISHPTERIRTIHSSTCAKLCLTSFALSSTVASHLPGIQIISDLCYIMYTSGSTGVPKGVMVQHSAVIASVIDGPEANRILREEGFQGKLRTLGFSNYAFDYSIWDIFLTLTSGGTLCLAPRDLMLDDLTFVLNTMNITFLETTPTVLSLVDPVNVPTLVAVYSSGEPLSASVRDKFLSLSKVGRKIRFGNGGAPTETTVMSVFTLLESSPADRDPRIFGKPFGRNRVYVLDDKKNLCPAGKTGTLWIGGAQVTKGYLGRDDLTEAAYCEDIFFGGRMYNTGDLCSWMTDRSGRLLHHGRKDGQVKIRGQRVEIGEVESAVRKYGRATDVYVGKINREVGTEGLVAFLVSKDNDFNEATLLHELGSRLPSYMVPCAAISLSTFPVTNNGKVNSQALKELARSHLERRSAQLNAHVDARPLSSLEKTVVSVWSACLGIKESNIPLDSNFLSCGGDSISAIHATVALRKRGLVLNVTDFLRLGTVQEQSRALTIVEGNHAPRAISYRAFELIDPALKDAIVADCAALGYRKEDIEDAYLCSPLISGLVSVSVNCPSAYTAHYAFKKEGGYNSAHLKAAWLLVLHRHPILRTAALVTSKGIAQFVISDAEACLKWAHVQFESQVECDHAADAHILNSPGFALGVVPTRIALFEGPQSSILTWQIHHSQYDGWCFPRILEDLRVAYAAISQQHSTLHWTSPTVPYPLFVRWLAHQDTSEALTWWSSELKQVTALSWPEISLPNDEVPLTDKLSVRSWMCGKELAAACTKYGITMSSFVRAALGIIFSMHANTEDVAFAVVTSGRNGDLEGIENVVGPCISTLPCRMKVDADDPIASLLKAVQSSSVASSAHHTVGLPEIIQANPHTALNVLLAIENLPGLFEGHDKLLGDYLKGHHLKMNYALAVTIFPSPDGRELRCQFEWDSRLVSMADIDYFSTHLISAFQAITGAAPGTTVGDLNVMSTAEKTFLQTIGTGAGPDPAFAGYDFFHQLLDHISQQFPSRIAIEHMNGASMTYKQLSERSNQVAQGLRSKGVGPEIMVPVLFDKDNSQIDTIVAFVSIMKAGGAFVPLDSSWPADRLAACVKQTNCGFLICDAVTPDIAHVIDTSIVDLDEILNDKDELQPSCVRSETLAYVMFTSGSTGKPKGVMIEHRNIMAYIANGHTIFPLKRVKRMLHFSPYTFDQGLADIFFSVSVGATLILANMSEMLMDMSSVLNLSKTDYALMTPAIAQLISVDGEYPHFKTLVVGGEKVPRQLSEAWRSKVTFIDAYGPTEATVHCISSNHTISFPGPGVIGRPLGSCKAFILNKTNLAPVGVIGELCISGLQLARGYLDAPETTAGVFVPNPFSPGERLYRTGDLARWTSSGEIEYLGRKEGGYVKLNGLRIDLGEVETALMSVKDTYAVVELVEYEGQSRLLAFISKRVVVGGSARVEAVSELYLSQSLISDLQGACRRSLPSHMIPSMWLVLNCIPQAASNKIDRKQLRELFQTLKSSPADLEEISRVLNKAASSDKPDDAFEQIISNIWKELLGLQKIMVHDDFFMIGGDSIRTVVCLARFKARGWDVSLKQFHEARTISRLASIVKNATLGAIDNTDGNVSRPGGLVVQIHSVELEEERARNPVWFIHGGGGFISPLSRAFPRNYPTIDSFAEQYLTLISPDENVYLAGWSSGGTLALAMAALRAKAGLPLKGVILTGLLIDWSPYESPTLRGVHFRHILPLLETADQPYCSVPVLLIRSEIPWTANGKPVWEYPPLPPGQVGPDKRFQHNFYSLEKMPNVTIVTVPGSDHISLMANSSHRRQVCDHIRTWCETA
ncbi:acetyl-CoA synthetase-like protein [Gymnopus androsaceus JB14]|uniref:Acetyl-CoA synthetase-like protein n=1 Tax=Gymnopus androsaceus JB14 TaxID=1447944 RepID=A0A6A4HMD3_9AGAR|nr:acetyl-CoA synthetase-like protein [Gymnopus androsaceus JB14]